MKHQFVKDLKPGVTVNDVFLCTRRDVRERRDGLPYLTMEFRDKTGSIAAIMWDKIEDALNLCIPGGFCRVQGRINDYQGRPQLNVSLVFPADQSEISRSDFLAASAHDPQALLAELRRYIAGVKDSHLRRLLDSFFSPSDDDAGGQEFLAQFTTAPAAQQVHHAYIGGLLEHTILMCRLAKNIAGVYPELNHDLLMAGIILHDIGKTREYVYETHLDHTDDGRLIGHIVTGYQIVQERIATLNEFPAETARMLLHIILSHHGQLEFGSPKTPKFAEALVVHFLDNLDARIAMFRDAVARNPGVKWTDFHQYLETNIYIPENRTLPAE